MRNLFLVIIALFSFSFSLAQTTYYSIADGDWSNAANWSLTKNGTGPAGPPTAYDNVVIDDSIGHSTPAGYVHFGNITIKKNRKYWVFPASNEAYVFGGSLLDIYGKMRVYGDLVHQQEGSLGSGLIIVNTWAKLHCGDDFILNEFGSLIIENPECGKVETCDDIYFNGSGGGICGTGQIIIPDQIRVWDNAGNEISPYSVALVTAANQICSNFPIYSSVDDCELSLPILVGTNTTFPVEFLDLQAKVVSAGIEVSWVTGSELNNDYFTLERAIDGSEFQSLATVKGAGTSEEELEYNHLDTEIIRGSIQYRIKQTDFDGKISFSPVTEIFIEARPSALSVFPNPLLGNKLHIEVTDLTEQAPLRIELRDLQGRLIYEEIVMADATGRFLHAVNIEAAAGYYLLAMITPRKRHTAKLIVR